MQDYEAPQIRTDWTNRVPTHLVDGVLGHSVANGVYRVIFGEVAFNEEPGAMMPKYQPGISSGYTGR